MSSASPEDPSTTSSTSTSRSRTPQGNPNNPNPPGDHQSTVSYFSYPVSHVVSGLYRRLTDNNSSSASTKTSSHNMINTSTTPEVFTPLRTASPFQPPPLTPLSLTIESPDPDYSLEQQLLTRALAEEIRLLVPARLQLVDNWRLAYSLDRDGASLATLYANCRDFSYRSPRAGYVLVVRDASPNGAVFGAYMTDPPHPDTHYYGTGECFLWRASVLRPPTSLGLDAVSAAAATVAAGGGDSAAGGSGNQQSEQLLEMAGLPLPPSADTTNSGRSTTLRGDSGHRKGGGNNDNNDYNRLAPPSRTQTQTPTDGSSIRSGTNTPESIRFKAFPYSGVNDYMMFCETGFLSLGGGDGHYGFWIDSGLEKGVSASCQTFGNEPLSDEGVKFDILDVEVWYIGT